VRRLTILLAALGALLLLPAASAFANGIVTVSIEGSGGGEVSSVGGIEEVEGFEGYGNLFEGSPPIECKYTPPGPATGECATELVEEEVAPGLGLLALHAVPAPGFGVKWIVGGKGAPFAGCGTSLGCAVGGEGFSTEGEVEVTAIFAPHYTLSVSKTGTGSGTVRSAFPGGGPDGKIECGSNCSADYEAGTEVELQAVAAEGKFAGWSGCTSEPLGNCLVTMSEAKNVTATFCLTGETEEECLAPSGPTNLGTLSVSKSGSGQGAVASKPKGIKCGNTCDTATASLYKESSVVLTAKAAVTAGSTFTGWSGCDSETKSSTEGTCTVKMGAEENVVASFGGTGKAVPNAKVLTLSKEGEGKGAVKASGLACEADCNETKVQYTGGEGKKLPAVVTLSQLPAPGSEFTGWSGCASEPEGKCVVTMSSAQSVTASYDKLPSATLTVDRSESSTGAGSISSKPKGVKCGATCTTGTMALYEGAVVVVTAKAATTAGSTFTGWSGASCSAETKSSTEGTCTITLSGSKTLHANFGGTKKAVLNPKLLTLTKGGSGYGTVKASGIACEVACTTTSVEYSGGEGKKLPATVTLEAISAPGSQTVVWSGCDSEKEGKCVVTTSSAKSVTATFEELE